MLGRGWDAILKKKHWKWLALCVVFLLLWCRFGPNDAERVIKNTVGTDAGLMLIGVDPPTRYGGSMVLCFATNESPPSYYAVLLSENVLHRFECREIRLYDEQGWIPGVYGVYRSLFYDPHIFIIDNPDIVYLGLYEDCRERRIEVDRIPFVYFWHENDEATGRHYLYTKDGERFE